MFFHPTQSLIHLKPQEYASYIIMKTSPYQSLWDIISV